MIIKLSCINRSGVGSVIGIDGTAISASHTVGVSSSEVPMTDREATGGALPIRGGQDGSKGFEIVCSTQTVVLMDTDKF